jgi:hypothetical protein
LRRADYLPLALILALAGIVGTLTIRTPRPPRNQLTELADTDTASGLIASSAPLRANPAQPGLHRFGDVNLETRRSSLGAPDFDPEDVRRRMSYGAKGTYIVPMVEEDSGLARWPDRPLDPIRVWVEPSSAIADWAPEYVVRVREAFHRWREAGLPVQVSFLVDSAGAEVRVLWTDRFPDSRIGSTRRIRDQHWWLLAADVTLAIHASNGAPLDAAVVTATAIHEVGHLLGLNHSPDTADVMASRHHGVNSPSPADLATARLLYSLPPGRLR